MNEILIRKDGSQSIANKNGIGVNPVLVDSLVEEHMKLREYGFHTGQVSSGAALEGTLNAMVVGLDPDEMDNTTLAMGGVGDHFVKWRISAAKSGLLTISSLSTEIELEDAEEGKQIRGGMGKALEHPKLLLVANYHDEASRREMSQYEEMLAAQGNLLRTESEENDFHAANIAVAVGAGVLMLCTKAEGFIYKGKKLDTIHIDDIDKYLVHIDETRSDNGKGIKKGGMKTKLKAAEWAMKAMAEQGKSISVVIGHSLEDSRRILESNAGTWVVQ